MKKSFTQNFRAKTVILIASIFALGSIPLMYSQAATTEPSTFIVEVQPSSFDVNQAVDLTIRAVDENGETITDYVGIVFIEIDGIVDTDEYVVPNEGLYEFIAQDLGVKTFSKGLIIKRPGSFSVKVSSFENESAAGQKNIIVGDSTPSATTEEITIVSPVESGIEKNNVVNVIASAPSLPNSPYQIFLNNSIVSEGTTSSIGDINAYISGVVAGTNLLQVKVSNTSNEIIGESESMRFSYNPINDGLFDSIQVLPSTKVKQGSKVTVNISTNESVSSAKITLSDDRTLNMDKSNDGLFTKEITMNTDGTIDVGAILTSGGTGKTYTGIAVIIVEKSISVGRIRLYSDSVDKTKLNVTRETVGTAPKYKVQYGTSDTLLDESVIVPTNEIIVQNLTIGATYYFQITPLDADEQVIGTPSSIVNTTVGEEPCVIKDISLTTQKIGDKYYLIWTGIQNVDSYIIYRSEFDTNDSSKMQKVGETTGTMFEYPFNKSAKKNEYAFYLVEAACSDGTNLKIDNAKRVQVGPVENILLFIVVAVFGYCIFRLYRYSNER